MIHPADEYSNTPDADSNAEDGGDTDYDSLSDYLNEDDIPDYKLQENNHSKGEQAEEIPFSDTTSFYETLKEQLGERNLTEHQRELAEYLIGSLDDDGCCANHWTASAMSLPFMPASKPLPENWKKH